MSEQALAAMLDLSPELKCNWLQAEESHNFGALQPSNGTAITTGCPVFFDSVLCWPRTPPNTWASQACNYVFNGVQYDKTNNATRFCQPDATWNNHTDYDRCVHILPQHIAAQGVSAFDFKPAIEVSTYIYVGGFALSFVSLVLALLVFINFKELKCLRNTIHGNLFLTYILSVALWMLTLSLQLTGNSNVVSCMFLIILYHYFNLTNFCWMLVEGLYLYMLVVHTFAADNLNIRIYSFIGWVCPALFAVVWSIVKYVMLSDSGADGQTVAGAASASNATGLQCIWMHESHVDWICHGPAVVCLLVNCVFLLIIMWVLITKLRSANTAETQQYRKAAKALLVLIPLLGITYLVVLYFPSTDGVANHAFVFVRALLLSTQGFVVALLYCFLNSEVRTALRHRVQRWREERNLRGRGRGQQHINRGGYALANMDNSPRSRTESIRLTSSCYTP